MMQSCIEEDPPYFQAGLLCKSIEAIHAVVIQGEMLKNE